MAWSKSSIHFPKVLHFVSVLLFLLSGALVFPLLMSLIMGDGIWLSHVVSLAITLGLGTILWFTFRGQEDMNLREGILVVGLTWLLLSLFGALPFVLSGVLPSYADAVFETMSGFTTTGATVLGGMNHQGHLNPMIEEVPKSLLFWRSLTHWIGGMGIIVLSIAILPLLGVGGMQLFQAESSVLMSDKLTPRVQETAQLLWIVYAGLTGVHFVLLWVHPSMDWFDALNHAFSTMATGGFSTKNASLAAFDSLYIDMVTMVFMFIAGINFILHFRMFSGDSKALFSNAEVKFYTKITLIAIVLVSASLWKSDMYTVGDSFRYGAFQVLSIITTTGYGTDDYETWNSFGTFVLFLLFFIGGCAGSTSGGIKIFRWMILVENGRREFKQIMHPSAVLPVRVGEKSVDVGTQRMVLSFVILYVFLFGLSSLIMTFMGYDFMSAIGASIASLGSIGPGFGDFGPTDTFAGVPAVGKWLLSLLMMIGRLELFTVLILFSAAFWRD